MSSTCYARNGSLFTDPSNPTYIPCNSTAVQNGQHSACCATGDLCLTNGLCLNPGDEEKGANHYWRVGCTDPTFNDPACPNFCAGKEDPDHLNALVFDCQKPRSYCCALPGATDQVSQGVDTKCCSNSSLAFQADDALIYTTARASVARVTSSPSLLPTTLSLVTLTTSLASSSTVSQTALPLQDSDASSSTLKVGLGVGLSLGLAALAAIGALIYIIIRRKRQAPNVESSESTEKLPTYTYYPELPINTSYEVDSKARLEVEAISPRVEIEGKTKLELEAHELPSEMYGR